MNKTLIVITGPTGIGKTALSILVAQHYRTEIISADSRQFFKELKIGVARPSYDELSVIKHHFIAFLSINERYSAGDFATNARSLLTELFKSHEVVVCVGGSGLYVDALINGFDDLPHSIEVRGKLNEINKTEGINCLQEKLLQVDPEYYNYVDIHNPRRVIRALEVIEITGKKFSELRKQETDKVEYNVIKLGLTARREFIYNRINARVDLMVENGLFEEVNSLSDFQNLNALNTVGYKEIFDYFNHLCTREEAIIKVKQHSRNYAKRQETYWKRDNEINFLDAESKNLFQEAIETIEKYRLQ